MTLGEERTSQRRVTDLFVGTTEAGEVLNVPPGNVWKILHNNDVDHQTLRVGKREMKVALRRDVERVSRTRTKRPRKIASA